MSSTTEPNGQRGQALVIFAGAMFVLALVAALAVDMGLIMLERRDEQNAADAAALAGARCLSMPRPCDPVARAVEVATLNGYTTGTDTAVVTVAASASRIQVKIDREVASIFGAVLGRAVWDVGALAVAVNLNNQPPFAAMHALSPDACPALHVTGTGIINTYGDVQVNSDGSACPVDPLALLVGGQGEMNFLQDGLACWVVGPHSVKPGQAELCDPPLPGVPIPFPINGMPSNTSTPATPFPVVGSEPVPDGCPGTAGYGTTACRFFGNKMKNTWWRLYPGYYPGGIDLSSGHFCLEPGIYHLAGGGFTAKGTGSGTVDIYSVDSGGTCASTVTSPAGGVLLFNTTHEDFADGGIKMGATDAQMLLWPLGGLDPSCSGPSTGWNRYLIFQDPANDEPIELNGGSNETIARGLILAPSAHVVTNGGAGSLTMDAIIAWTFKVNGGGGNINVLYDECALPTFTGYGLVI